MRGHLFLLSFYLEGLPVLPVKMATLLKVQLQHHLLWDFFPGVPSSSASLLLQHLAFGGVSFVHGGHLCMSFLPVEASGR